MHVKCKLKSWNYPYHYNIYLFITFIVMKKWNEKNIFLFIFVCLKFFFVDLDKSLYYSRRYHKRKHFLLQIWCFSSAKELSLCHKLWFSNLYIFATQCHRPRYFKLWILLGQMISEAQLGLLLWGAIYYFVRVKGVGKGGFPPFSKIFQKQKCFFKRLKSKKRFFLICCSRFDCVQFKSIFLFLCFYKI